VGALCSGDGASARGIRLSIVAALARVDDAEFGVVRDAIEVSDPVLSKQVGVLEAAGYVRAKKGYVESGPGPG
jgi:DNA-binding transcriptional ArsR family regulator